MTHNAQATKTPRRPLFGTPLPPAACDGACCATVPPPPRVSGVSPARRGETIQGVGPKPAANDNGRAIERQRDEVARLTVAVLDAIAEWQRARDAETRAAVRCMRTAELAQATRDAEAQLFRLEDQAAAAEATLAMLEAK